MTTQSKIKKSNKRVPSMANLGAEMAEKALAKAVKRIELPTDLKSLTMKQLVDLYNRFAEVLKLNNVQAFANKAKAVVRVEKLAKEADDLGVFDALKPTKKIKIYGEIFKTDETPEIDKAPRAKGRASTKKFTFGSKVSSDEVKQMIKSVFGDAFKINKVEFIDNHYWYCTLRLNGSKLVAKKVRVDYLVNYLRIPRAFKENRKEILANVTIGE